MSGNVEPTAEQIAAAQTGTTARSTSRSSFGDSLTAGLGLLSEEVIPS
jgi:hypothetical protein